MKKSAHLTLLLLSICLTLLSNSALAQKKIYTYEKGKEYFTIELDTDEPTTWGTYRALNHHQVPYFEMTFISTQKQSTKGDTIMIMVPTFYSYSYNYELQGVGDTINDKKQTIRFHFQIKDKGKKLEYIQADSITRARFNDLSMLNKKEEVDITSFPAEFTLTKKPKWSKFPEELRTALAKRLIIYKERGIRQ